MDNTAPLLRPKNLQLETCNLQLSPLPQGFTLT